MAKSGGIISSKTLVRLGCVAAGNALAWYFAGPICEELVRDVYSKYYYYRFGEPGWVDWSLVYLPMKGHLGVSGYNYGSTIVNWCLTPLFAMIPDMFSSADVSADDVDKDLENDAPYLLADTSKAFLTQHKYTKKALLSSDGNESRYLLSNTL
jgi:hypothetical protein